MAPTEAPTEAPRPALTEAGQTIQYNGTAVAFVWHQDAQNKPWLNLAKLAGITGWAYTGNGTQTLQGHEVSVQATGGALTALSIDGVSFLAEGRIWNDDLYVSLAFLQGLGASEAAVSGGALTLTFPQE